MPQAGTLHGIHVALLTPFDDDGHVAEGAFAQLVEDQVSAGMSGVLVAGGTGEGLLLEPAELQGLLRIAVEVVGGRVPVTVQVGALSTAQAVRNAEHARDAGAAIGLLPPPFSEPVGDEELVGHYTAVARCGLPLMIYNNPAAGVPLSVALVERLAEIDGIDYLKDSADDPSRLTDIALATEGHLQVLHGKDTLAMVGFLSGLRASVWGAPNATPHACLRLYELAARQDWLGARALWQPLYPVLRFFETQGYVAAVKAAAGIRGVPVGPPRLPLQPLPGPLRSQLAALLDDLDAGMVAVSGTESTDSGSPDTEEV